MNQPMARGINEPDLARMVCVREDWGIYCGAVLFHKPAPQTYLKSALASVRALIRNSPDYQERCLS